MNLIITSPRSGAHLLGNYLGHNGICMEHMAEFKDDTELIYISSHYHTDHIDAVEKILSENDNIKVVLLMRQNIFQQAVSLYKLDLYGKGVHYKYEGDLHQEYDLDRYDYREVRHRFNSITTSNELMVELLYKYKAQKNLEILCVYYEDLIREPASVLKKICSLFGIEKQELVVKTDTVKLANEIDMIWYQRFLIDFQRFGIDKIEVS